VASNFIRGCKLISSLAVFTFLCALIAILLTVIWCAYPFCDVQYMMFGRWIAAGIIGLYLVITKRIVINPHRAD